MSQNRHSKSFTSDGLPPLFTVADELAGGTPEREPGDIPKSYASDFSLVFCQGCDCDGTGPCSLVKH